MIDTLLRAVRTAFKVLLWLATALLGLAFLGVALAVLLGWLLVQRLRGRSPRVVLAGLGTQGGLAGRFSARFGGRFAHFGTVVHPQETTEEPSRRAPAAPLGRRPDTGPVVDVEPRDLPPEPPRP